MAEPGFNSQLAWPHCLASFTEKHCLSSSCLSLIYLFSAVRTESLDECWVLITLLRRLQWSNLPLFSPSYASSSPQIILTYCFHLFTLCLHIFSVDRVKMALSSQGNVPPLSGILFRDGLPDEPVLSQDSVFAGLHWPHTSSLPSDTSLSFMAQRRFYLFHSFTQKPCTIFEVFRPWAIALSLFTCSRVCTFICFKSSFTAAGHI